MILDSYTFPKEPTEVDPESIQLHVVKVSPKDYIELVVDDRRYLIREYDSRYKIGDLIHLKPVDEQSAEPSLFHRLKRFFRGDNHAFDIYTQTNLYVITCEDHFDDCKYQVIGIKNVRR